MSFVKLTLTADDRVVRKAKKWAHSRKTCISALFRVYMVRLVEQEKDADGLGPLTRQAMGLARLPQDKTDRTLMEEALMAKYGRGR